MAGSRLQAPLLAGIVALLALSACASFDPLRYEGQPGVWAWERLSAPAEAAAIALDERNVDWALYDCSSASFLRYQRSEWVPIPESETIERLLVLMFSDGEGGTVVYRTEPYGRFLRTATLVGVYSRYEGLVLEFEGQPGLAVTCNSPRIERVSVADADWWSDVVYANSRPRSSEPALLPERVPRLTQEYVEQLEAFNSRTEWDKVSAVKLLRTAPGRLFRHWSAMIGAVEQDHPELAWQLYSHVGETVQTNHPGCYRAQRARFCARTGRAGCAISSLLEELDVLIPLRCPALPEVGPITEVIDRMGEVLNVVTYFSGRTYFQRHGDRTNAFISGSIAEGLADSEFAQPLSARLFDRWTSDTTDTLNRMIAFDVWVDLQVRRGRTVSEIRGQWQLHDLELEGFFGWYVANHPLFEQPN